MGRKAQNMVIKMGFWTRQNVTTDRGGRSLYNSSRTMFSLSRRRTGGVGGPLSLSIDVVAIVVPIIPVSIDVDFSDCCCCRSF